jgi:hypothetical protein
MNASNAPAPRQESELPTGRERFLSAVVDHALNDGWRTAKDFLRHFTPRALMEGLSRDAELRARVLMATTRVNERLALRKTLASAAEDLTLALEEGLTDPDKLVALIPPDDRVRYLDPAKLWSFVTEVEFWKGDTQSAQEREVFVKRVTFIVEQALGEGVLRVQDVADGIGFKRIATCLPRAELQRVVEHALSRAREGQRLTEDQLLEAVPLRALMTHVPLDHTWNEVIVGRLAKPLQFIPPTPEEAARPSRRLPPPPPSRSRAASSQAPRYEAALLPDSFSELQRSLERSSPPAEASMDELMPLMAEDSEETRLHMDLETRVAIQAHRDDAERAPADDTVEKTSELERVTLALGGIGRLPVPDPDITLPILLSIESMYAELVQSTDETERYTVVRDAFPNHYHLRVALLALIRLLDPGRRSAESGLAEADADLLIRTFLFEERHVGELDAVNANHHMEPGVALRPPLGQFS